MSKKTQKEGIEESYINSYIKATFLGLFASLEK